MKINLKDEFGGPYHQYRGEVELICKNRAGQVVNRVVEQNIIKIYAKEIISHRIVHNKVWDTSANSGAGAWVSSNVDENNDFAIKYFLFGASFDENGSPLDTADTRFYTQDLVSNGYVPIRLGSGAEYSGGLINPVPISEPTRPLKKIERMYWEPSYQPAGSPFLDSDVRAINNVLVVETELGIDEYNGLGDSNYLTITEIALAAGAELDDSGACECDPTQLFLEGVGGSFPRAILVNLSETATVTIDSSDSASVNVIKEGDIVKLVDMNDTAQDDVSLDQTSNYYLVITKAVGGSDITLDRVPTNSSGDPLTGQAGIFRDTLRIFSHRVLTAPVRKSENVSITARWRIFFS